MIPFLAMLRKEFILYFKNAFIGVVISLTVIVFCVIYFIMPRTVNDTIELGVVANPIPPQLNAFAAEEPGLVLKSFDTEDALATATEAGKVLGGFAFAPGWADTLGKGGSPQVRLVYKSDLDPNLVSLMEALLKEVFFELGGESLSAVHWDERIVGTDLTSAPIPARERMRPLIVLFILITEIFGMGALVAEEKERRTDRAVLITRMSTSSFFLVKSVFGFLIAFTQALLVFAVVGGFVAKPFLLVTLIALGAAMVVGISLFIAALADDFISVAAWGAPVFILLIIPGLAALFPGAAAPWVRVIPSYPLVDGIHRVTQFGAGWSQLGPGILLLAGFDLVAMAAGVLALRRHYR